jgi:hypothetical protein
VGSHILFQHFTALITFTYVKVQQATLPPRLFNGCEGFLGAGLISVIMDADDKTISGKLTSNRAPNSLTSPGDQN